MDCSPVAADASVVTVPLADGLVIQQSVALGCRTRNLRPGSSSDLPLAVWP